MQQIWVLVGALVAVAHGGQLYGLGGTDFGLTQVTPDGYKTKVQHVHGGSSYAVRKDFVRWPRSAWPGYGSGSSDWAAPRSGLAWPTASGAVEAWPQGGSGGAWSTPGSKYGSGSAWPQTRSSHGSGYGAAWAQTGLGDGVEYGAAWPQSGSGDGSGYGSAWPQSGSGYESGYGAEWPQTGSGNGAAWSPAEAGHGTPAPWSGSGYGRKALATSYANSNLVSKSYGGAYGARGSNGWW